MEWLWEKEMSERYAPHSVCGAFECLKDQQTWQSIFARRRSRRHTRAKSLPANTRGKTSDEEAVEEEAERPDMEVNTIPLSLELCSVLTNFPVSDLRNLHFVCCDV